MTPQQRTRFIAASAGLAAIIGVSAIAFRSDDHNADVNAILGDAGVSRTTGAERFTDLLTAPVEPGATIVTGVNLPRGARAKGVTGPGTFEIISYTHRDDADATWLEVTAENRAGVSMRFVGFVAYNLAADGGL